MHVTQPTTGTVYVVDDDERVRTSYTKLLEVAGFRVQAHATAKTFLAAFDRTEPGCLVLDLQLRRESGLALQDKLRRRHVALPIIFVSGHGDVRTSVHALRSGAIDFLEKPIRPRDLLARVREALERWRHDYEAAVTRAAVDRRVAALTPRERQVAARLLAGETSKEIATVLGMSARTAEGHRRAVFRKMEVPSAAALVRLIAATDHPLLRT
jgi:two-component system response regulator TtrR